MKALNVQNGTRVESTGDDRAGEFICLVQTSGWGERKPDGYCEFHFGGRPVSSDELKKLVKEYCKP